MTQPRRRPHLKLLFVATAMALPRAASAQDVQSIQNSDIGNVVSATMGDTTFSVSASTGAVTKLSGTGVRLSTGTTRSLVTIACNVKKDCDRKTIKVEIGSVGSPTRRARALTSFNVASGTATVTGVSGTNPLTFSSSNQIQNGGTLTFWVGMDFPIAFDDPLLPTGSSTSGFYVYVCAPAASCTPTAGSTAALAIATVFRPISLAVDNNLVFGSIRRPTSGSGTVTLTPAGARTVTGTGAFGYPSPVPGAASYTVGGEGGQVISLTIPSSFALTKSGGGSITVTTSNNASASPVLTSSVGNAGSYSFQVGGSFPVTSTTPLGAYSGTYSITVQYN